MLSISSWFQLQLGDLGLTTKPKCKAIRAKFEWIRDGIRNAKYSDSLFTSQLYLARSRTDVDWWSYMFVLFWLWIVGLLKWCENFIIFSVRFEGRVLYRNNNWHNVHFLCFWSKHRIWKKLMLKNYIAVNLFILWDIL